MSETEETTWAFLVTSIGAMRSELRALSASLAELRAKYATQRARRRASLLDQYIRAVCAAARATGAESGLEAVERVVREREALRAECDELAAALATARKTLDEERRDVVALAHERAVARAELAAAREALLERADRLREEGATAQAEALERQADGAT